MYIYINCPMFVINSDYRSVYNYVIINIKK